MLEKVLAAHSALAHQKADPRLPNKRQYAFRNTDNEGLCISGFCRFCTCLYEGLAAPYPGMRIVLERHPETFLRRGHGTHRDGDCCVFEPCYTRTPCTHAALPPGMDRLSSRLGEQWRRRATPPRWS